MIGKVYKKQGGSGGGDIVNGIIEQYKASTSTISANSFVEFVNNDSVATTVGSSNNMANCLSACLIDTNKVFIVHGYKYSTSYTDVYATVVTVSNANFTIGSSASIATGHSSTTKVYGVTTVTKIDTNKVLVTHGYNTGNSSGGTYLNAVVCSVSGTTISVGTSTRIVSKDSTSGKESVGFITSNKVIITYSYYNSSTSKYGVYGVICTISNLSITLGTETLIRAAANGSITVFNNAVCVYDTNKFLSVYNYNDQPYSNICTISNTTITPNSSQTIVSTTYSPRYSALSKIKTNHIFFSCVYYSSGSNYPFKNRIIKISGNSIIIGAEDSVTITTNPNVQPAPIVFDENNVVAITPASPCKWVLYNVNDTTITAIKEISVDSISTGFNPYAVSNVDNSSCMWIAQVSSQLGIRTYTVKPLYMKESVSSIDGITKDEITTSTAGDVWVLNQ